MTKVDYKSNRENKVRVVVGDIFIPRRWSAWSDAAYMIVSTTRPVFAAVRLGGRRSGEVSILNFQEMQRSYWIKHFIRF